MVNDRVVATYFDGGLHDDSCGIVDAFRAQIEHCVVTLVFGLRYVLIYFLENGNVTI